MADISSNNHGREEVNNNIYYTLFKRSGIPFDFTLLIIIRWMIGMCGFFLNLALFYVTLKTRSLFGTCNFLIGFNAFCAAITSPFLSIGVVIVLSQIDFIPIWTCFSLQLFPLLFSNLFIFSMFAIGIDRLFSIIYSIWHSQLNKTIYLGFILAISFLYAFLVVILCYIGVEGHSGFVVLCANPGEVYQGDIGTILFRMNLCIISLTILCYLLLWILMRSKKAQFNGTFTQKIMKSLICMVLVITFGYLLSVSSRIAAPYIKSQSQIAYFAFISSIISVIAMGANGPILFIFSMDYRKAFRKYFPRFFKQNSPATISNHFGITRIFPG